MNGNQEFLSRKTKNNRRKTKSDHSKNPWNAILNFLIAVVGLLIIVSIIMILTNTNVKKSLKNDTNDSVVAVGVDESTDTTDNSNSVVLEDDDENEQSETNDQETAQAEEDASDENAESFVEEIESELQYITTVESDNPLVAVAWTDSRWQPYQTEQTGTHLNVFDSNHIDYQEKLALLYRDTGFTEADSIVWNVKNNSGGAVAVISSLDKQHIFRLTMKWVPNEGWQTVLLEQLYALEGAY